MATAKEAPKGKSENCVILNYIEELNSPELLREFEHGQKDLLERLKEFLIGKNGQEVKRMEKESAGARISHRREKVVICGTQEQTCYAAKLIREKIREFASKSEKVDDIVPIKKENKGYVNLDRLNKSGNTYFYPSRGHIHIVAKDKEEAKRGALTVQREAVKGRRKKEAKERKENRYCFVDDMSLEDDADLKLELDSEEGDKNDASNNKFYFTLKVCSDSRKEVTNASSSENFNCSDTVQKAVRETLDDIKIDSANAANTWIDMWVHFGQVHIRGVQEADEGESLSLAEARKQLESSNTKRQRGTTWKTNFREGISITDSFWESSSWEFKKDLLSVFDTRIDLNIITPSSRSLRFKVWIARPDFKDNIKDAPLPNDDFQSVIGEVVFTDPRTRAMCKGWLCTETEQPLKVDVILPALPFSFRYGIRRGSFYKATQGDEENEDKILLNHLGKSGKYTPQDEEPFTLEGQLPDGFSLDYERLSHRTMFRLDTLTVTVSNEKSWKPCRQIGTPRTTCDLRVRNMAWEDAFQTNTWEPHDIAEGVKDFLKNLKSFADILHRELLNESEDT